MFDKYKIRIEFGNDLKALLRHSNKFGGWVAEQDDTYEWFSLAWTPSEILLAKPGTWSLFPWGHYEQK
jgi:hypothetical protein